MTLAATEIRTEGRSEWLEARKQGIGASDVAAIVGLSKYRTPLQVWADKTGRWEQDQNEAMRWGSILQDVVLDEWQKQHDMIAAKRDTLWANKDRSWMMATVDALAFEGELYADFEVLTSAALGVVEAKTSSGFGEWDELPEDYEIQVQWQLAVTGLTHGWVAALHGGRRFQILEVEQDLKLQQRLIDICQEWWNDYVVQDLEPPAVAEDVSVLADLYDVDENRVTYTNDMVEKAVRRLARAKANKKRWDRVEKEAKAIVTQHMGSATELVDSTGSPVATWREQQRNGYTVEASVSRVLRLK